MTESGDREEPRISTGIPGFDEILIGGLTPERIYLVQGEPGAGKTTFGLQFLLEGARRGESAAYVTLSESEAEVMAIARSHGWSMEGISVIEVLLPGDILDQDAPYTMFHPAEVELGETLRRLLEGVERVKPRRLVIDSLAELRLLAQNALQYRRQVLRLKQFLAGKETTVILLDAPREEGKTIESIAHGVVSLERISPEYGKDRRRLVVEKMRGMPFREGYHDFSICHGGIEVFPRLVAAEHRRTPARGIASSGIPGLDSLLNGGLDRSSSTLLLGPAGSGKSSIATRFAITAAERGERISVFSFDEDTGTMLARSAGLGMDLKSHAEAGRIRIRPVDPAELSPGEFAHAVRQEVEKRSVGMVIIDSLNGYLNAMPEEKFLLIQLHELLTFLRQNDVVSILVMAQHGILGAAMQSPVDTSYLADAVLLLRYFEAKGEVRLAISALKKRGGAHERSIREMRLTDGQILVGEPLRDFRGVMTGVPWIPAEGRPSEESHVSR